MGQPPAIIFGDGIAAYGVIRALAPCRIPSYVVSRTAKGIAARSRFARKSLALPPDDEFSVPRLIEWLRQEGISEAVLIVAGVDDYLDILSERAEHLPPALKPTFPHRGTVQMVRQKSRSHEVAKRIGIPVPATFALRSHEDVERALDGNGNMMFPLFMKPERKSAAFAARWGAKGIICNGADDVRAQYERLCPFPDTLLLQEMIPGGDNELYNLIAALNAFGEPIAVFMNRKRRSFRQFSHCTLMESTWSDLTLQYSLRFLKEIGYFGCANPEFKYDHRDGRLKLLEVNGRVSMSTSHALRCGINIPLMMYREALHGPLPAIDKIERFYPDNILWWCPGMDVGATVHGLKKGTLTLGAFCKSLLGRGYIVEPFWWRDPLPAILTITDLVVGRISARVTRVFRRLVDLFRGMQ